MGYFALFFYEKIPPTAAFSRKKIPPTAEFLVGTYKYGLYTYKILDPKVGILEQIAVPVRKMDKIW